MTSWPSSWLINPLNDSASLAPWRVVWREDYCELHVDLLVYRAQTTNIERDNLVVSAKFRRATARPRFTFIDRSEVLHDALLCQVIRGVRRGCREGR